MKVQNTGFLCSYGDTEASIALNERPILVTTASTGDATSIGSPILSSGSTVQVGNPGGLQFNITYDPSVTNAPNGFTQAIAYVANYYASVFSDAITINLDVGWGEVGGQALGGALGASQTYLLGVSYSQLRSALQTDAKTAGDTSALASLPTSAPFAGNFFISTAEARALGVAVNSSLDGYVGFSSSATYTFDANNQSVPGAYDFIAVAQHEISEVMGRMALVGGSVGNTSNGYSALDLFRYSGNGTRQLAAGQTAYFSTDGGKTNLDSFNTTAGGDWGDWAASAGNDSYDAFISSGSSFSVTSSDLTVMDAIGWDLVGGATSPIVSSDGSILLPGSNGSLLTNAGTWTFSPSTTPYGNVILLNGQSAAGGSAVELEVANQGQLYADNSQGQWWAWNGSGWGASANPTTPSSPTVSPDGSILMAGNNGNLVTGAGTWTFSPSTTPYGNLILLNGQSAAGGSAVELETANQGHLYADNSQGQWWAWNGSGWSASANPTTPSSPTVSPDGSILMTGGNGNLVTGAGTWTFSPSTTPYGNLILLNGQSAAGGSGVELEVANQGHLYADNLQGQWWAWNGSGWSSSGNPTTTVLMVSDQATLPSDLLWPPVNSETGKPASVHTFTFDDMSDREGASDLNGSASAGSHMINDAARSFDSTAIFSLPGSAFSTDGTGINFDTSKISHSSSV